MTYLQSDSTEQDPSLGLLVFDAALPSSGALLCFF
jgi:hypothetical protein